MSETLTEYLIERFELDGRANIQLQDDEVHCRGVMPNSNELGWFFAGYLAELEREAQNELQTH